MCSLCMLHFLCPVTANQKWFWQEEEEGTEPEAAAEDVYSQVITIRRLLNYINKSTLNKQIIATSLLAH